MRKPNRSDLIFQICLQVVVKHTSPRHGGAEVQDASKRFLLECFLKRVQHCTVLYNDVREELTGQRSVCRRRMSAELM